MENKGSSYLSDAEQKAVIELHREASIVDALQYSTPDIEYLELLRSVGINAVHYTVAANSFSQGRLLEDNFITSCQKLGCWFNLLNEFNNWIELATSIEEMQRINRNGKIAIFFGFQEGSTLEDNLDYLNIFKRLGVSIIMLTYNSRNMIGSGCGESNDTGLSDFGFNVIKKMNDIGMLIDLSHCGYKTTMDAIEVSRDPVIFTHANARGFADEPRNKTDEHIKALANNGGLICIKAIQGNMAHKKAEHSTVRDVVDQIEYLINLVGIEYVGIGSDFRGTIKHYGLSDDKINIIKTRWKNAYPGKRVMPTGFSSIVDLPNITSEMIKRGYSDDNIKLLLGENFVRVFRQVVG